MISRSAAFRSLLLQPRIALLASSRSPARSSFATLLSGNERQEAIQKLTTGRLSWDEEFDRNAIRKTFHFMDFAQAWSWMSKVAQLAEEMNHHPEWKNIYNTVEVTLTTHDCGGVSELDIKMAEQMDSFAAEILPNRV